MKKTTYYLGLNDKDSKIQKIDIIEAYKITENIALNYFEGVTISNSKGIFKHEDGKIVIENSLIVTTLEDVKAQFISDLKKAFNQESIMVETKAVNITFQ